MSFLSIQSEVEKLSQSIIKGEATIDSVILNSSIFNAITNQNKVILNFLFENFNEIAEYAFSTSVTEQNKHLCDVAFKIIMSNSTPMVEFISKKDIFDVAIETFRQRIGTEFDLLRPVLFIRHIFENCNPVSYMNEEDSSGFMQSLLDNSDKLCIYDFMVYLINEQKNYHRDSKTQQLVQRINWFISNENTFQIFFNSISSLQPNSFILASHLLCATPRHYTLHEQLTSETMVSKLLEIALNPANIEISEKAFILLVRIIEQMEPKKERIITHSDYELNEEEEDNIDDIIRKSEEAKKNMDMKNTEVVLQASEESRNSFEAFLEFLNSYSSQLIEFITSPGPFTAAKRLASDVLLSISEQRTEFIPEIPELFLYLFNLIQEIPTCDFAALQLCKTLKDMTNSDNKLDFDYMPMCQWIMEITSNKSSEVISYWGIIDEITNELNILIRNQVIPLPTNWNQYITEYFIPRAQLVRKRSYGGPAYNGNAKRFMCVDDFDAEKRAFELPPKATRTRKRVVKKEFNPDDFEEEDGDSNDNQQDFIPAGEEDVYEEEEYGQFFIEEEEIYEYENDDLSDP